MDDQSNLFNKNSSEGTPPQNSGSDDLATLLNEIKNDKGEPKYRSVSDALYALKHSQEYIPTLKRDLDEARAAAERVKELERAVEALSRKDDDQAPAAPVLDESKIADIVSRTVSANEAAKTRQRNTEQVVSAVASTFGDKAEQIFYNKAQEMGLSRQEMNDLAARSPQAVFKMLGIEPAKQTDSAPLRTSVNTAGMEPPTTTYVKRNDKSILMGATTRQLMEEQQTAAKLVEELHSKGKTTYDLTNPKEYFKHFGEG